MLWQFAIILNIKVKHALPLFGQHVVSILIEIALRQLRCHLTDVPPQPNSPPSCVCHPDQQSKRLHLGPKLTVAQVSLQRNK